jgi:hypothetical protein
LNSQFAKVAERGIIGKRENPASIRVIKMEEIQEETYRPIDDLLSKQIAEAEKMATLKHNKKVLLDRVYRQVEKMLINYPTTKYRILNIVREEYNLAYDEQKEWENERRVKILIVDEATGK